MDVEPAGNVTWAPNRVGGSRIFTEWLLQIVATFRRLEAESDLVVSRDAGSRPALYSEFVSFATSNDVDGLSTCKIRSESRVQSLLIRIGSIHVWFV